MTETQQDEQEKFEVIPYVMETQETVTKTLDVTKIGNDVWLTQKQIAELFKTDKSCITKHITNIYAEKELSKELTRKTSNDKVFKQSAKNALSDYDCISAVSKKPINFYNLDMIISIGFRVNSKRAVKFRQWANEAIREGIERGYQTRI